MNSLYGRFGMHTDPVRDEIVTPEQSLNIMNKYKVQNVISIDFLQLISYTIDLPISEVRNKNKVIRKMIQELPGQTNVPIAAAVTAYSRMLINQYKLKALQSGLDIYYSDTDSLVLNGPFPEEYCDPAKLGMLKLEHVFREGIFVSPKIYFLELEDGTSINKCKGYSGKFNKEQYLSLLKGQSLDLRITRWTINLEEGIVQVRKDLSYRLNPIFLKRNKVFNSQGVWIDTRPLVLNLL